MNSFKHIYIFIALLILNCNDLTSQDKLPDYNFVNIKDGISKRAVSTIIQDHLGFVWIGTNGAGLHKYDGMNYTSYNPDWNDENSLHSGMIYCSYLDSENRLWIGTEEGLNVYNRELDRFEKIRLDTSSAKGSGNFLVKSITGNSEFLYIGTYFYGLYKLNLKTLEIQKNEGKVSTGLIINDLVLSSDGTLYVGTNYGLQEYDVKTNSLKTSKFSTDQGVNTISVGIESLLNDTQNNIWIGTASDGLYKITKNENSQGSIYEIRNFSHTDQRILSLLQTNQGHVLCGTENDGLHVVNPEGVLLKKYRHDKFDKKSIRTNSIWSLFADKNKRIWIGYYNNGAGVYDKLYDKFKDIESLGNNTNSLQVASVTGLIQDKEGRLWISMDGGGVDIYDITTNKFIHTYDTANTGFAGLTSNDIQTIFHDSQENVWIGSWSGGIFYLEKGSKNFVNYIPENSNSLIMSNRVMSFAEDSKGTIWIGTFLNGLHSFNPKNRRFTHHNTQPFIDADIQNTNVRKILVDFEDNIWLATTQGLYKVVPEKNNNFSIIPFKEKIKKSLNNRVTVNYILSLYQSSDGIIWIGTDGYGLCKYDRTDDSVVWYDKTKGLLGENVNAITESYDHNIWMSSNNGIFKLDRKTDTFINYTKEDGLLANDFNYNSVLKGNDNYLYFGGYKGINYFDPGKTIKNDTEPLVHFTGFKLFNKQVLPSQEEGPLKKVISETDSISLTHKQSVFTIDFVAINYTRPEKNQYAYYLQGFENSWNYVGNTRNATYTNLEPGEYVFKVKASNNDGVWSENSSDLRITVLSPWWKTKLAIFSYVFFFLLGIIMLNRLYRIRLREKQQLKFEREKRLQEDELHEKKLQFFTNISHEFRTPLTLILNPLKNIIDDEQLQLPEYVRDRLLIMNRNSDRLSRLINELMDYRKLESNRLPLRAQKVDVSSFVMDIVDYFKEEALSKHISIKVERDTPSLMAWIDINMLEKIIFNLLSNAFKVTPANGRILVRILSEIEPVLMPKINDKTTVDVFEINIEDTGPGLKKEEIQKIFERFYQVDNLEKRYYGGTGIGLQVVRNFVDLHKGKMTVDSKVDKGTKFSILFPKGNSHLKEDELIQSEKIEGYYKKDTGYKPVSYTSLEKNQESEENKQKYTLLIVEDNLELRDYIKSELKNEYAIIEASNGKQGLKLAKEKLPDLIVTDVIMPKMDGLEFCMNVKKNKRTSHIPVLMLTAKTMVEDRLEGIDSGADAYLNKPFDIRLLKSRLSQLNSSRKIIFDKYFKEISNILPDLDLTSADEEFVRKVSQYINDHIGDPDLNVESLATQVFLSRSQLYRKIKSLTGLTVNEFLRRIRLEKAKQLLESGNSNVSDISYKVGFSSPSYFTKCFKNHFNQLPTEVFKS